MFRKLVTRPGIIRLILCAQIIPLLALPADSYALKAQEWWLPAFLTVLTILSLAKILPQRSIAQWPWYLLAFSQGFNIISRIMTLFPHATKYSEGVGLVADGPYIGIAIAAMLFSAAELLFCELPEVRQRMSPRPAVKSD